MRTMIAARGALAPCSGIFTRHDTISENSENIERMVQHSRPYEHLKVHRIAPAAGTGAHSGACTFSNVRLRTVIEISILIDKRCRHGGTCSQSPPCEVSRAGVRHRRCGCNRPTLHAGGCSPHAAPLPGHKQTRAPAAETGMLGMESTAAV